MELKKIFKATPKEMDLMFDVRGEINCRYYEILEEPIYIDENKKYRYMAIFRADEELKSEIKKARGFKGMLDLYKKYNKENLKECLQNKILYLTEEIRELEKLSKSI